MTDEKDIMEPARRALNEAFPPRSPDQIAHDQRLGISEELMRLREDMSDLQSQVKTLNSTSSAALGSLCAIQKSAAGMRLLLLLNVIGWAVLYALFFGLLL